MTSGEKAPVGPSACTMERQITRTVSISYLVYPPKGDEVSESGPWPLMIFLHGAGERGSDLEKVKTHGPMKYRDTVSSFPFLLVAPQCPEETWWQIEVLDALFDEIVENYPIDRSRIYITGLSMGGFGTWNWAARQPDRFAAALPICGGGNPADADALTEQPIWAFHGTRDNIVALDQSERMVDAVKQAGGDARLTVYPDAAHDSWTETYENPEIYAWFLKHKR